MNWEGFILNIAFTTLFAALKNPTRVKAMNSVLRKLRDILNSLPLGETAPLSLTAKNRKKLKSGDVYA